MTKPGVVLGTEDAVVAAAARHFSFPPPRTGGDSCSKLVAQVDLGAAAVTGSWLDSMKASSPRHKLMAPLTPGAGAEHDDWMERHPSALDRFDALGAAAAKGKQVAVFLDYDGTLSPIVEDPGSAVMTDETPHKSKPITKMLPGPGNSRRPEEVEESGGASKLHHGGLLGLATCSMAINLVVCEPPPGLEKNAYFLLALSVIFFSGVAHVFAAIVASDDPRGRAGRRAAAAAPSELKYIVSIAPFVVAAGLSVASFMW